MSSDADDDFARFVFEDGAPPRLVAPENWRASANVEALNALLRVGYSVGTEHGASTSGVDELKEWLDGIDFTPFPTPSVQELEDKFLAATMRELLRHVQMSPDLDDLKKIVEAYAKLPLMGADDE